LLKREVGETHAIEEENCRGHDNQGAAMTRRDLLMPPATRGE
jgi:hypothetical protein